MPSSGTPANVVLRVGIVALTLGTALIHLSLNFPDLGFMLNGLGYLTLLAALCLPVPQVARHRDIVRWVLIGYAALTILLWILLGDRTAIGYTAKAIEVALITLLLLEARRSRS
ncbi:MAG: hypothetical protein M3289_01625 [Actinomycetota bacterium]|jgi:hypothetical protein|nr:hypothetical protein [Actinomycetota bacterium]MDQ3841565.1 hypothetical protein [Actinomycetota bacterium]MDQ3861689.1 hypothetical protein [Actinomycetota bacterium]MDQ5813409.1 hypothetical protein [Actinomycetota bacterium]